MDKKMKTYAIIGAAGYVAPRHMRAIQATGGKVVAACDHSDSVGVLDSFGYDIKFYTNGSAFWNDLPKISPDYLVVCTPNRSHKIMVIDGMDAGCDIICEKPLALSGAELDMLQEKQALYDKNIHPVLQLRYHPSVAEIRQLIIADTPQQVFLAYHTPRGPWYDASWKGDDARSGGILFNIGIHMFDYLLHIFGPVTDIGHVEYGPHEACGDFQMGKTHVDWALKISVPDPKDGAAQTARILIINGYPIDFTKGFEYLHTTVYSEILAGRGLTPEDTRPAIHLVEQLKEKASASNI